MPRQYKTPKHSAEIYDGVEVDGRIPEETHTYNSLYEYEQGNTLKRYDPVTKAVCGRVWSDVRRQKWMDRNGKEHMSAYFKLFLWSGEEKYRCEVRFEQADEAAAVLRKHDWVVCFGMDDIVETYKAKKRYHNFRVVKLWIMPEMQGVFDWRPVLNTVRQLVRGYQELNDRLIAIEEAVGIERAENVPAPKGDEDRSKKRQSLRKVVGDIYEDTEDTQD